MSNDEKPILHKPVLLEPVLEYLQPREGETYLDLTAGYGGHAAAVAHKIGEGKRVLVDRDQTAAQELSTKFEDAQVIQQDYLTVVQELENAGFKTDMVLMDLGVSSVQFDTPQRGFSFRQEGP